MYTYTHISRLSYAQLYLRTWAPAHARAHMSAHTHASAHRRRRRAQRPAPRPTTRRARPACGCTPARAGKGGAYRGQRGDRRGVPRADVRVERRRRVERLRAEPPAVNRRREGARMCRRGCMRARSHARTRVRTDTARGRVCAAGWHRRSVRRCS